MVLEDIRSGDFEVLLHFMYHGQVDIPKEDLDAVLSAAQFLKIRGLIRHDEIEEEISTLPQLRRRKSQPKVRFLAPIKNGNFCRQFEPPQRPTLAPFFPLPPPILPTLPPILAAENSYKLAKTYTSHDMDLALDCLREGRLSLTRASEMFKIPATTLWQRANKLGIATPKKESAHKTWSDSDLDSALDALRKKEISANKASKLYGIPSSVKKFGAFCLRFDAFAATQSGTNNLNFRLCTKLRAKKGLNWLNHSTP